ncbi:FG-GAP repeat protein [Botrimarina hoheduenensis]|uniref:PEP-CTERM protein-sorting domain-containing protein n=1 Tax=Botrimarina hoheduenensis TaxID=2528000 RepID=A0A5C5W884_9BACT|nr:FG-GAP repeat protein [Botrimarina hoheduenensis]TWT46804.1 hypothetical protein Pla111_19060 [Botrimarina hoheduenensis]
MIARRRLFTAVLIAVMLHGVATPRAHAAFGDQLLKLTASDAAAGDRFGNSVALDGGVALVGSWWDDDAGSESGAAYLFDVATGAQLAKLTASDAAAEDIFGVSVAINGGVAIVGSPRDDDAGNGSGSAYLFDVATGAQLAKLTASDAAAGDRFGNSVALDGGVALVGSYLDDDAGRSSGAAYLFDVATGTQLAKLTASDAAAGDRFGQSVALDSGVALVGSPLDDDAGTDSGSAYLFDVATGAQLAKLTASDAAEFDYFGYSVALDNGVALVGSYLDDDAGRESGSAYLFDVATGAQLAKLTASDASFFDQFGQSVAIDGGVALVGSFGDDDAGGDSGAAYLFDVATGTQLAKLTASDAAADDFFGLSVALDGGVALVGSYLDDDAGNGSGSAYLFDAALKGVFGDFNGDGTVDNDDLNLLLTYWGQPASPTPIGWNGRPPQGTTIDNSELNELLGLWGVGIFNPPAVSVPATSTDATTVPEPHTLLLALAAFGAGRARRPLRRRC